MATGLSVTSADTTKRRMDLASVAIWALGYALVLCTLRVVVLAAFGTAGPDPVSLAGSFLRLPGHLLAGTGLGFLVLLTRRSRFWSFPLVVCAVFANLFADHYEAILAKIPGPEIWGYIAQAPHMKDSIVSQAPPLWVSIELVVVSGLLAGLAHVLWQRPRRQTGMAGRSALVAVLGACVAFVAVMHARPDLAKERLRNEVRMPTLWVLVAGFGKGGVQVTDRVTRNQARALQAMMGIERPFASGAKEAPMCSAVPRAPRRAPGGRSVIVVVLESVGFWEMEASPGGEPLLPQLRRVAMAGFSARRMQAVGTQTCQSLTALYSGQMAQPWDVVHWREPLPRFGGLPATLLEHGYRTAYFHGAGLGFEKKREFLRMVGMRTLFELDARVDEPRYGWGWSDAYTFGRFEDWIEEHVATRPDQPLFAVIASLSAHHPYHLPADWTRRFATDGGKKGDFHETLRYTDEMLGRFFDWYLEHEAARGTYLVVTSDHAPLYDNTLAIAQGRNLRFDVPFVVVGPPGDGLDRRKSAEGRLASQMDVPATIGGLLGIHPGPCDQGLDLLEEKWPEDRIVAGVGGRELDELYMWSSAGSALYRRRAGALTVLAGSAEPFRSFLDLFLPVTRYLLENDAHVP